MLALGSIRPAGAPVQQSREAIAIQLLAFNDFHGHLEPPTGSNGLVGSTPAGGAEFLATHLSRLSAAQRHTVIVAAGDTVGATPLLSAMFHDEPAVESLNAMGLDISSVGNHEFDEGWSELLRKQKGGCHPADGCQDRTPFAGAAYQYLAANVVADRHHAQGATTMLPGFAIKELGGVRIGFIGLTLQSTPRLVIGTGVQGLRFDSEVAAANRSVRSLKAQGVRAIIVLIHQGGVPAGSDYNGCDVSGPIVKIAERMSDDIDVIISGHTHHAYNCTIDGKLVTSAAAFGRVISVINLTIDPRTADVASKTARNVIVTRDVPRDPAQTAIIEHYRPLYAAVGERVVGTIATDLTRTLNRAGESVLGDLIADSTLETTDAAANEAVVAFVNPGGIRADLVRRPSEGGTARPVTYAEASAVLPFRNRIVVVTLTGRLIKDALEQQFDNIAPGQDRMLQVSRGFSYSYNRAAPKSRRVDPRLMMLNGRQVVPNGRYRVAINEFIAAGGDNFDALTRGTDVKTIGTDLDILIEYFKKHSPLGAPPTNRIARTD